MGLEGDDGRIVVRIGVQRDRSLDRLDSCETAVGFEVKEFKGRAVFPPAEVFPSSKTGSVASRRGVINARECTAAAEHLEGSKREQDMAVTICSRQLRIPDALQSVRATKGIRKTIGRALYFCILSTNQMDAEVG